MLNSSSHLKTTYKLFDSITFDDSLSKIYNHLISSNFREANTVLQELANTSQTIHLNLFCQQCQQFSKYIKYHQADYNFDYQLEEEFRLFIDNCVRLKLQLSQFIGEPLQMNVVEQIKNNLTINKVQEYEQQNEQSVYPLPPGYKSEDQQDYPKKKEQKNLTLKQELISSQPIESQRNENCCLIF